MAMKETLERLETLGEGSHRCYRGWIAVERKSNCWDVMWTTGKDTHFRGGGAKAISVQFKDDWSLGWVFKSAITMWPVRDSVEREEWATWMEGKIKEAANPQDKPIVTPEAGFALTFVIVLLCLFVLFLVTISSI